VRVQWNRLNRPELDPELDFDPPPWTTATRPADDDAEFGFDDPAFDDPSAAYDPAGFGPGFSDQDLAGTGPDFEPEIYAGPRRVLPVEDEPTVRVARYLFPTERYRGEWRRHWVRPFVRYLVTFGLAWGAQFLVPRFVPPAHVHASRIGVAVAGGLVALHVLFAWQLGRFVLTNRRVMLVEGVVRRRVSMAPLPRAADLRFEQSVAGRVLNYGDFVFERKSLFSRMRVVAALPAPDELYLRTVEEVYEPGAVEARLGRTVDDDA
jgi:hypothetical protein